MSGQDTSRTARAKEPVNPRRYLRAKQKREPQLKVRGSVLTRHGGSQMCRVSCFEEAGDVERPCRSGSKLWLHSFRGRWVLKLLLFWSHGAGILSLCWLYYGVHSGVESKYPCRGKPNGKGRTYQKIASTTMHTNMEWGPPRAFIFVWG